MSFLYFIILITINIIYIKFFYKKLNTDAFMFFYYESYDEIINSKKIDHTFNGLRLKLIFPEHSDKNQKKDLIKISIKNILETKEMKIQSWCSNGYIKLLDKDNDEFLKKWEKMKNEMEDSILFIENIKYGK